MAVSSQFVPITSHCSIYISESKPIPALASARIQCWALTLSAYNYCIQYKPGSANSNADVLSKLPLPESPSSVPVPGETIFLLETVHTSPLDATQIRSWTNKDPILAKVRTMILQGWTHTSDKELQPYQLRKDELSVHDGCILIGSRVVILDAAQTKMLDQLHQGYPGITRMKGLARSFVWRPGMDHQLEQKVKACPNCQQHQNLPATAPLHPWEWPRRPWARVHVDYAGLTSGKMLLITVDTHSKWIEIQVVSSETSRSTIDHLRTLFATHGLPKVLVSDNGTPFTSGEFTEFVRRNGIRHVRTASYHPSSHGLAERAVKTVKEGLRKSAKGGSLECQLARLLFQYRITPHYTTGVAPAELLFNRQIRSHISQVQPDLSSHVESKQLAQKRQHDVRCKE